MLPSLELTEPERMTLQELADHHPYADFRRRALGIPAFPGKGHSFWVVADIFGVTLLIPYNWAKAWRTEGAGALAAVQPRTQSDRNRLEAPEVLLAAVCHLVKRGVVRTSAKSHGGCWVEV